VLTATANASGVATFTVTFSLAGTYSLVVKRASGVVISTQTVKVLGVSAAADKTTWDPRVNARGPVTPED
jgi:hypothetical protein